MSVVVVDCGAEAQVPIAQEQVSVVMGPQFSTMKRLEKESGGAKFKIKQLTVVIVGTEETVSRGKQLVEELLQQHKDSNQIVTIASELLGQLIGPKGSTIKALQQEFKSKIDIPKGATGAVTIREHAEALMHLRVAAESVKVSVLLMPLCDRRCQRR